MNQYIFTLKYVNIIICISCIIFGIILFKYYNTQFLSIKEISNSYDYIIVGAGTSGAVVASKLSANSSKSVLLIEAGDEFNIVASIPLLSFLIQGTKNDWAFKSEPQKYSSHGLFNQVQFLPRGKGVGGSNQINYLVHGTDIKSDAERWRQMGLDNWENIINVVNNPDVYNTSGGNTALAELLLEATKYLKYKVQHLKVQNSIHQGQRWTSYHSHLKNAMHRDNLHVAINTRAVKVHFKEKHAFAIELSDETNNKRFILSRNEIILSAGTFNTPQILLLSGIGPEYDLTNLKIAPIANSPGVGRNLHDRLNMPLYVTIETPISLTLNKILKISEIWKYFIYGKGHLSTSPNAGYIRRNDTAVLLYGMGSTDKSVFGEIANIKPDIFENLFPFHKNTSQEGFVLLSACLKSSSRGFVKLKSTNPFENVLVNPQYLSKNKDVECMIRAVKLANDIINTKPFKKIGAKLHWPHFANCENGFDEKNDEYLGCIIKTAAFTGYHPGGTCKVGDVVDKDLKVKGVTGLRVMDASVLPEPLSTYPNSILIAMAEHIFNKIV